MGLQSDKKEQQQNRNSDPSLYLEWSQLEFLMRVNSAGMAALAPMRRFILDRKSRVGFYKFLQTVERESQELGVHTDERQIVNADVERQLNDIFGKNYQIKICKPEEHGVLKLDDGSYGIALLQKGAKPTIFISELLLRSQDHHSQNKLHYQTALCEMIVGLLLARNKLSHMPHTLGSRFVRLLSKEILYRGPGIFGNRSQKDKRPDDYDNRSGLVMYSLSIRNLMRFFKNPKTLTWIPSLDSIIRGGQQSIQEAMNAGFSVALSWAKLGIAKKELLQNTFDRLVDLSERTASGELLHPIVQISDQQLREGAVAARYVAQLSGVRNPVQTCEAALFSAFPEKIIEELRTVFNFQISPRGFALIEGLNRLKKESFDIIPKLDYSKATHALDYQQALLMKRCIEISGETSGDKKYVASDLFALYLAARTAELGAFSDKASKKNMGDSIHKESKFTLLPLMERLNLKLFNEMGYLLLRAFSPEITSNLKKRVSEQCGQLDYSERKRFLNDVARVMGGVPDCRVESREKSYFSLYDKFEESSTLLRNFGKKHGLSDRIEQFLKDELPKVITETSGKANHVVDLRASQLAEDWVSRAMTLEEEESRVEQQKLYKNIFALIRNTDNLGIRLISSNPDEAIEKFKQKLFQSTRGVNPLFLRVSSIEKPEGKRTILDGEWIIDRVEIEIRDEDTSSSKYLELEIHAMTDQVNQDQKLGLGQYKYAFAHWVMKAKRSVCQFLKMDEEGFAPYSGIIPLQKDPPPPSNLLYQHFDQLWKSLSKHGTFYRVANDLVCIPHWDTNPDAAVKATKAYREANPNEEFVSDQSSVFSQMVHNANKTLKELRESFQPEHDSALSVMFEEDALRSVARHIHAKAGFGDLPESFVNWFRHYYLNICEMHPDEVKVGLTDTQVVESENNKRTTAQLLLDDIMRRAQLFFAVSKVEVIRPAAQTAQIAINANADLLGYNLALFRMRREVAEDLGIAVPPIRSIIDMSAKKNPNSQRFFLGMPKDCTPELFEHFLREFSKRVECHLMPLNAKNTKKSIMSKRIQMTALDDEYTLEHLYRLAEKFGISINQIRVETGRRTSDGVQVADFTMSLKAVLRESELTDGGMENTELIKRRLDAFVTELRTFRATNGHDDKEGERYFILNS